MGKYSTRDIVVTAVSSKGTKEYKNLHFDIKIQKTLSGVPNSSELVVFNLNQESREFLSSIYDGDGKSKITMTISLDDKKIFTGDMVNVSHVYMADSADWVTSIFLSEGWNAYQAVLKKEIAKGSTREKAFDVMVDSLKDFGVDGKLIEGLKSGCGKKSLAKRLFVSGNVMENLKKLINDCMPENDLSIENGQVKAIAKNAVLEKIETVTDFLEPPTLNDTGLSAMVQLNDNFTIGGKIKIKAKSTVSAFGNLTTNRVQKSRVSGEGTYKVIEVSHAFDNYTDKLATTEVNGVYIA